MVQGAKLQKKPLSALASGRQKGKQAAHSSAARGKTSKYTPQAHASKSSRVVKQQKQMRKSAAGLTSNLERRLAERAGYTEMIGVKGGARRENAAQTSSAAAANKKNTGKKS